MINWFVSVNGEQKGPYPTDQLRQLVSDGFVARDAYVWREGMANWQPLSQVRISDDPSVAAASVPQAREPVQSQAYSNQAYGGQSQSSQGIDLVSDYVRPGYFSFHGRISRKTYWLSYFLPIIVLVFAIAIGVGVIINAMQNELNSPIFLALWGVLAVLYIVVIVAGLASQVKRLHDRGRSGWFILLQLVPIVQFWILIEVYFLKGTPGPNAFGPDPLS